MAKTKRRQLAALAELKALAGYNERTSSCDDKSGPSGTIPQTGDPMIEIRTQRVIFKIPALPRKPAADTQSLKVAKKEGLGYRRRKHPQKDIDLSSEQVPADEAKISKGIFQFGKWKRHKKIRDLLPPGGTPEPSSSPGLPNGGLPSPVAISGATDKHVNGELPRSGHEFQKPSKKRVQLITGPRKRSKLEEAVVRSSAEKDGNRKNTQETSTEPRDSTLDRAASSLVMSKRTSRDLGKDTHRLQELARASDGDLPSTLAHSPPSRKRRRGAIKKVISPVPVSPKARVVSPHRTRAKVKISHCEAMALEVLQEIQNVKNISQHVENHGKITANDTRLLTSAAGGEAVCNTRNRSQVEPQNSGNFTSPLAQEDQLAHAGVTVESSSQELMQSGQHTSYHNCSQGNDAPGDFKSRMHIEEPHPPFSPKKQVVLPVVSKPLKNLVKFSRLSGVNCSGAEMIKRNSQLTIMEKRLQAAGGLRNWLLNKDLGQFVPILEKWNIDNRSLLQLTMEGLKSMGLVPVGPRRKLIHAISCLILPSFSTVSPLKANRREISS